MPVLKRSDGEIHHNEDCRGPEHLDEQLRRVLAFIDRLTPKAP